jgi:hypothetical protein
MIINKYIGAIDARRNLLLAGAAHVADVRASRRYIQVNQDHRLISRPAAFSRAIRATAEVARTGLITEFISGETPSPSALWHPWQFMRYRSEP